MTTEQKYVLTKVFNNALKEKHMKIIIVIALCLIGCTAPSISSEEQAYSLPPVPCGPGGTCLNGMVCADDGHCGLPCGTSKQVSCNLGEHCYHHRGGSDCYPDCLRNDMSGTWNWDMQACVF